jgi:hypothetical protein
MSFYLKANYSRRGSILPQVVLLVIMKKYWGQLQSSASPSSV